LKASAAIHSARYGRSADYHRNRPFLSVRADAAGRHGYVDRIRHTVITMPMVFVIVPTTFRGHDWQLDGMAFFCVCRY
jgi:hypothetical protein